MQMLADTCACIYILVCVYIGGTANEFNFEWKMAAVMKMATSQASQNACLREKWVEK